MIPICAGSKIMVYARAGFVCEREFGTVCVYARGRAITLLIVDLSAGAATHRFMRH